MNGAGAGRRFKHLVLVVAGTVLGLVFLYLAFRDISWSDLSEGLTALDPVYLAPGVLLLLLAQLLRAIRFGLILRPFCPMRFKDLWDVVNVWAALNMVLPARSAELVKPYLLRQWGAPFSSTLGAVLVERVFDLGSLLTLLAVVLWTTPQIPPEYAWWGKVFLGLFLAAYFLALLLLFRRERAQAVVDFLVEWLPERGAAPIRGAFSRLIDGLGIMASAWQCVLIFLCSLAVWLTFTVLVYLLLKAFAIDVSFLVALTIQVFLCFGVALPSAPGFVGTFHAVGRYTLALFGVAAVPAVSFATVYHVFSLVVSLLLGLISYWGSDIRFDRGVLSATAPAPEATHEEPIRTR
jgi:uncharacterized protein (TIRG00374 family)